MTKSDFEKVQIGDILKITVHGINNGKVGIVREIDRRPPYGGHVYLEPVDCEFEFHHTTYKVRNTDGFCRYCYQNVAFNTENDKAEKMFNIDGIINEEDIVLIDKFIKRISKRGRDIKLSMSDHISW